ncbi:unnamed protein product [Gadus morhua 'NCC']
MGCDAMGSGGNATDGLLWSSRSLTGTHHHLLHCLTSSFSQLSIHPSSGSQANHPLHPEGYPPSPTRRLPTLSNQRVRVLLSPPLVPRAAGWGQRP